MSITQRLESFVFVFSDVASSSTRLLTWQPDRWMSRSISACTSSRVICAGRLYPLTHISHGRNILMAKIDRQMKQASANQNSDSAVSQSVPMLPKTFYLFKVLSNLVSETSSLAGDHQNACSEKASHDCENSGCGLSR